MPARAWRLRAQPAEPRGRRRAEEHYGAFDGLNLCFETREGILKHCSRENARKLGALGERFLQGRQPSLEAQLANIADEIAYNNHDVDDGLRSGLITIEQLAEVELWQRHYEAALAEFRTSKAAVSCTRRCAASSTR